MAWVLSFSVFGLSLQDSASLVMREFSYFHDKALYVLMTVAFFIGSLLGFLFLKPLTSTKYLEKKSLELVWTLLPTLILVGLALPSLTLLFFAETPTNVNPGKSVKAIGHQWYWTYKFQFGGKSFETDTYMVGGSDLNLGEFRLLEVDNPIPVPVSVYTRFATTSADVIHSFAVPSLGLKMDAVPGRMKQQFVIPNLLGVYYGQCSEICGANHSFMPMSLEVAPEQP